MGLLCPNGPVREFRNASEGFPYFSRAVFSSTIRIGESDRGSFSNLGKVIYLIRKVQLPLQTLNLIVGFAVWVIISSLVSFMGEDINIPPDKVAIITAIPVVLGSVLRIPIGYYTNIFGARLVFLISFVLLLFPVYYISEAKSYVDLIIGGLFLGIGGAVFSVGVTSLPKYYPKERHGLVNGVYGLGNLGTAVTSFRRPSSLRKSAGR